MSQLKELREKRAAAWAKAVEFLKVTPQTVESRASFDAAEKETAEITTDIERIERADKVSAALAGIQTAAITEPTGQPEVRSEAEVKAFAEKYRKAWLDVMRNGHERHAFAKGHTDRGARASSLETVRAAEDMLSGYGTPEQLEAMSREQRSAMFEKRDQSEGTLLSQLGTYTGLGFFIPAGFVYQIEQATKFYAPLLEGGVFTMLETATGQPLPYPTSNDTTQKAVLVAENVQVAEQDATAGNIQFGAWKYTSGLVRVSFELLQDSAFDLEKWLAGLFGIRWGRGMEDVLTNGSGVSRPNGLLTAIAASGATAVIAVGAGESSGSAAQTGANSIGNSDLVDLEHSVDPTYRRNARYMFHDKTLASLKKVLDKFGRPLWAPSIREGDPDRINGYPYVINQAMPQIAASNTTVAFGAMDKFLVRRVKDLSILRLTERYADFGQVAFVSFARIDSNLLDAGTHPVNVLQQHS